MVIAMMILSHIFLINNDYPVNSQGQTYGKYIEGKSEPDLIEAEGNSGVIGYVKKNDVNSPKILTTQKGIFDKKNNVDIPVYKNDGKTIIDTFSIGIIEESNQQL